MGQDQIRDVLISVASPKGVFVKESGTAANPLTSNDRHRREIGSKEFDELRTIHPNERLVVKGSRELKPGEEVVFGLKK